MEESGTLIVVGSGIQCAGHTTLSGQFAIKNADIVLFAVTDHFTVDWIHNLNKNAKSLPYPLDDSLRKDTYNEMVSVIMDEVRQQKNVCAVFYGHPGLATTASHKAIELAKKEGYCAIMQPGISAIDCLFSDIGVDPNDYGCQIYETTDYLVRGPKPHIYSPLILLQPGFIGNFSFYKNKEITKSKYLTVLSRYLGEFYPDDHKIILYEASIFAISPPRIEEVTIEQLPEHDISDLTTLYIPPLRVKTPNVEMLSELGISYKQWSKYCALPKMDVVD